MGKIIGIDLGTTNSCVAVMEGGQPVVIPNSEGSRTTPSIVGFTKNGERLVGEVAKRQAITNPSNTVISIKRYMGTEHRVEIEDMLQIGDRDSSYDDSEAKSYSPQEISAMILRKLKKDAESYLGEEVTDAVITVPAYFTDSQRQATKDAGKIAGLRVERIINEPTSAALAYGLDNETEQRIMVYDLGGGTFDVSIIAMEDGVIEVLATGGNNSLGGDDFDDRLVDYIVQEFEKLEGIDLSTDKMAMQRVRDAAEKAKKELSTVISASINLPFITMDQEGPKHIDIDITRAKFDELTEDLVEKTMAPVKVALEDAETTVENLDKIILVGGSTRIPAVQEAVKNLTNKEPFRGINPDECVALGAAIQGGKLAGDEGVNSILLLDVTPLSLGIETLGGVATKLIPKNTTIPTNESRLFTTAQDDQSEVEIIIFQGEEELTKYNKMLGKFVLGGIVKAPKGVPQIKVAFDIDSNGIVHVSAKDLGTGLEQKITVTSDTNLTEEDIEDAIRDAEEYSEIDKRLNEAVLAKNNADAVIFQAEKAFKELESRIDLGERQLLEGKLVNLKDLNNELYADAMSTSDVEILNEESEKLKSLLKSFAAN